MGDWQGSGGFVAQVVPKGDGKYQANILTAFDTANNLVATLQGETSGDTTTFSGDGWNATIKQNHFAGGKDDKKFDLAHVNRTSPTLGAPPPKGAIVLFDGRDLNEWAKKKNKEWLTEDGPAKWKLLDGGIAEVVVGSDCIITHKKFGNCKLHVEFRTIGSPSKSAVFLETRYEVNINETDGRTEGNMTGGMETPRPAAHHACAPRCRRWRGRPSTSIFTRRASIQTAGRSTRRA